MKKTVKNPPKLSSATRLEELLQETELELETLEPKIEKLEKQLEKLKELKLAKQKLITLKLSIKSILSNFSEVKLYQNAAHIDTDKLSQYIGSSSLDGLHMASQELQKPGDASDLKGLFLPERAFAEVNNVLRKRTSLNYEMFRAIVFNGGRASTEQIRRYLIDHRIRQPASGEGFESVELTDVSSRVNYLVRKGLVQPDGRGNFVSLLGWTAD